MIKNERQYRITKAQAERFESDLRLVAANALAHLHPLLIQAQRDALASQLRDLREELAEYEQLREGKSRVFTDVSLESLPHTLIQARIAAGWSQKELGDHLGLKEQQIQRYEATEYATASLERLREIALVLGVELNGDVFIPGTEATSRLLLKRFEAMGLDRNFVLQRLLPPSLAYCVEHKEAGTACVMQTASIVKRVFKVEPSIFLGSDPVALDTEFSKTARFKVGANANEKRLSAYTLYAHYLALLVLEATEHLPVRPISTDARQVHQEIIQAYGTMTLHSVLSYMWDHSR
jgi:transcriptional regulator with XRE-family HTH domain